MENETITPEEIARHYSAALDSVTVVNELMALDTRTEEQEDAVDRNVRHLELMLTRDYWTTEDLTPFTDAIAAGKP